MTTDQFDQTRFRRGDKIRYEGREYPIDIVLLNSREILIHNPYPLCLPCTEVEHIPVKEGGSDE